MITKKQEGKLKISTVAQLLSYIPEAVTDCFSTEMKQKIDDARQLRWDKKQYLLECQFIEPIKSNWDKGLRKNMTASDRYAVDLRRIAYFSSESVLRFHDMVAKPDFSIKDDLWQRFGDPVRGIFSTSKLPLDESVIKSPKERKEKDVPKDVDLIGGDVSDDDDDAMLALLEGASSARGEEQSLVVPPSPSVGAFPAEGSATGQPDESGKEHHFITRGENNVEQDLLDGTNGERQLSRTPLRDMPLCTLKLPISWCGL